jgi:O-antigen ligase
MPLGPFEAESTLSPMSRKAVMKAKIRKAAESADACRGFPLAQTLVIGVVLFAAPLIAGGMTSVASLAVQSLVFTAALLWVVGGWRGGRLDLPPRAMLYAAGAFFALLGLSAVDSVSLHATLRELLNVGSYLLVFLMIAGLRKQMQAVYVLLAAMVVSAGIVGALGIREYALAGDPGWRAFSTFFNPDFLAGFAALMLPISLSWFLSKTSPAAALVAATFFLLVMGALLLSGSRFGLVAAAGGIAVFGLLALLSRSVRRPQWIRLALLVLPVILVAVACRGPLSGRIDSAKAESHSGAFRLYTWQGTARMAASHPLNGTGLGTFEVAYPRYAVVGYTKLAHNSYLQIAAEAGPVSAVALVVLLLVSGLPVAAGLVRGRIRDDSSNAGSSWTPDRRLLLCGLLGGAAASMARNLIDGDWYITAIGIGFWAVLGAAVALSDSTYAISKRVGVLCVGVLGAALVCTLAMLFGALVAWNVDGLAESDPLQATECYRSAARFDPLDPEYHRRLGGLYMAVGGQIGDSSYLDRAEDELLKAISLESTAAKNYYQLALVYECYPRWKSAVRALEAALERDPNSPQLLLALARQYEQAGRDHDALMIYRRMAKVEDSPYERVRAVPELVEPSYVFARYALAMDLERAGRKAAAHEEYQRALKRVLRYQASQKKVGALLDASGRRDFEMEEQVEKMRLRLEQLVKDR